MLNKILASIILILLVVGISGCTKLKSINSFEDCVNAGNPVMESYPRQCRANGETFTEELESKMTIKEALEIAENSECTDEGRLIDNYFYNQVTRTWWIGLDLEKSGCSPACVVRGDTETAYINWRCTGLILD